MDILLSEEHPANDIRSKYFYDEFCSGESPTCLICGEESIFLTIDWYLCWEHFPSTPHTNFIFSEIFKCKKKKKSGRFEIEETKFVPLPFTKNEFKKWGKESEKEFNKKELEFFSELIHPSKIKILTNKEEQRKNIKKNNRNNLNKKIIEKIKEKLNEAGDDQRLIGTYFKFNHLILQLYYKYYFELIQEEDYYQQIYYQTKLKHKLAAKFYNLALDLASNARFIETIVFRELSFSDDINININSHFKNFIYTLAEDYDCESSCRWIDNTIYPCIKNSNSDPPGKGECLDLIIKINNVNMLRHSEEPYKNIVYIENSDSSVSNLIDILIQMDKMGEVLVQDQDDEGYITYIFEFTEDNVYPLSYFFNFKINLNFLDVFEDDNSNYYKFRLWWVYNGLFWSTVKELILSLSHTDINFTLDTVWLTNAIDKNKNNNKKWYLWGSEIYDKNENKSKYFHDYFWDNILDQYHPNFKVWDQYIENQIKKI